MLLMNLQLMNLQNAPRKLGGVLICDGNKFSNNSVAPRCVAEYKYIQGIDTKMLNTMLQNQTRKTIKDTMAFFENVQRKSKQR